MLALLLLSMSAPPAFGAGSSATSDAGVFYEGSGLPKEIISKVIRRHWPEIKECYEVVLDQHPELLGKIVMRFAIDPAGTVAKAEITEDTMNTTDVGACIVKSVMTWTFPAFKGPDRQVITYPWIFKTASPGYIPSGL